MRELLYLCSTLSLSAMDGCALKLSMQIAALGELWVASMRWTPGMVSVVFGFYKRIYKYTEFCILLQNCVCVSVSVCASVANRFL